MGNRIFRTVMPKQYGNCQAAVINQKVLSTINESAKAIASLTNLAEKSKGERSWRVYLVC
jgi:hypothetical protein